jgi:peptidoglycan/LPS O-acetylase OafA/YrhL
MPLDQITARLIHSFFPADAAVIVFFVLSGYVLTRSLQRSLPVSLEQLLAYAVRRAFRLMPLAIVAAAPYFLLLGGSVAALLGAMLLYDRSLNGVLWTLQVEVVGSGLLAVLYLLCLYDKRLVWLTLAVSLAACAPSASRLIFSLPPFVVGAALYHCEDWPLWRSRGILVFGILLLMLSGLVFGEGTISSRSASLLASTAIVGCCRAQSMSLPLSRPVQFLGAVSYPLYLLHGAGLLMAARVVDPVVAAPLGRIAAYLILTCILILPLSWFLHRTVELPGIELGSRIIRRLSLARRAAA